MQSVAYPLRYIEWPTCGCVEDSTVGNLLYRWRRHCGKADGARSYISLFCQYSKSVESFFAIYNVSAIRLTGIVLAEVSDVLSDV